MAKRTRRPILGMGPDFVDALQARATAECDTPEIAYISLGGGFNQRDLEAIVAASAMVAPKVVIVVAGTDDGDLGSEVEFALDRSIGDATSAADLEGLMRTLAHGFEEPGDMSGVYRTLAHGFEEPGDMSGVYRTLARGR